jgi:hypothetical protein
MLNKLKFRILSIFVDFKAIELENVDPKWIHIGSNVDPMWIQSGVSEAGSKKD